MVSIMMKPVLLNMKLTENICLLQTHSKVTSDLSIAFASLRMENFTVAAAKMELYVCGKRLSERHMDCGNTSIPTKYLPTIHRLMKSGLRHDNGR